MKKGIFPLAAIALLAAWGSVASLGQNQAVDDECRQSFIEYLRGNFDDIHDVSMRFHHLDHTLNGLISFDMEWEEGRLRSCRVRENETGHPGFAEALIRAMEKWNVDGMKPSCPFFFTFRIKLVGSDDPEFAGKGILTGEVTDSSGSPVANARITISPADENTSPVPDGRSNREGIFVRTLIPPGKWRVTITCPGYRDFHLELIELQAGEHKRLKAVLKQ